MGGPASAVHREGALHRVRDTTRLRPRARELLARGVGIRFKGEERHNVEEYCVSEGWIRVAVGKTLDRKGQPLTIKLNGEVEPYFRDNAEG